MILKQVMRPGSLQTTGELDTLDNRIRLVNIPLVDISFKGADEVSSVRVVSIVHGLMS